MTHDVPRLLSDRQGYSFCHLTCRRSDQRRKVHLGPSHDPDTRLRYYSLLQRWETAGRILTAEVVEGRGRSHGLTVADLAAAWIAEQKAEGRNTERIGYAMRHAEESCAQLPAAEFGPRRLKAVRKAMVDRGLSVTECNWRASAIVRAVAWAVSEEMLPGSQLQALRAVKALAIGHPGAKPARRVQAARWIDVEPVLDYLSKPLRALTLLLWHTGARVGELCALTPAAIDRTSNPWTYQPTTHKTQHLGKVRVVPFFRPAREVVEPFLSRPSGRFLFRPEEAMNDRATEMRQGRQTPLWQAHLQRYSREADGRAARVYKEAYDSRSFAHAIRRAIARCNRDRLSAGDDLVNQWHPHMLRHAAQTRFEEEFGARTAALIIGHELPGMSSVQRRYTHADWALAFGEVERGQAT